MVFIGDKAAYQLRINEIPKMSAFNNLLLGKSFFPISNSFSIETDEIYLGVVRAILSNDKTAFETHYLTKKKSNPTKESPSPFVNDDFLIFCLIVGITKFGEEKTWIKNIISLRSRNPITITFENLSTENYFSKSNLPEIVLMFFQLNNQSLINNEFLNTTYKSICENTSLFESKSDFQIVCSLRAYDLIIELKEAPHGSEIAQLRVFNKKFLKRIKVLSWMVQSIILIIVFYGGFEIISRFPTAKIYVDHIGSVIKVLGIIGLSQLGNLFPVVRKKSYEFILLLFGYPIELIAKENFK
ncbi:MAG: hypothetical protein KKD31_07360 [Bacteroidetes bacterium]|nr:hypothetical protein [Bacteroidota bacterium]